LYWTINQSKLAPFWSSGRIAFKDSGLEASKQLRTWTLTGWGRSDGKLVKTVTECPNAASAWEIHQLWSPIPSNSGGKAPESKAILILAGGKRI
jgi:hypothetical protein